MASPVYMVGTAFGQAVFNPAYQSVYRLLGYGVIAGAVLVGLPGIAPHYQFVVSQNGPMTALRVEVEVSPDAADDQPSRKAKATEVKHQIKEVLFYLFKNG